jgi:2',3'-cyclic-nucleotide 2'-phosphodiesterase (5'-nucleotidase family)
MLALTSRCAIALCLGLVACRGPVGLVDAGRDAAIDTTPPRGRVVALVYSSNVNGEIERCACAVSPLGGLARRAAEMERIRREVDGVVSVDAGDLFLPWVEAPKGKKAVVEREVERRARVIAEAYGRMGMSAVTPGEADLELGRERLARLLDEAKVPGVSANLTDLEGKAVFEASRVVDVAGVKVGIFGVTAADAAKARAAGWLVGEPAPAARAAIASLRARGAKIVVALLHVGAVADSRRLLREVPGVDWAVLGHSGRNLELPEPAGGARMVEAMAGGKNLGRVDLHVVAGDGRGPYAERAARAQLEAILADHRHQVAEYERLLARPDSPEPHAFYEKRLADLRRAIARETAELAAMPATVSGNWFESRVVPMDTALPDQPEIAALIEAYKRESGKRRRTR